MARPERESERQKQAPPAAPRPIPFDVIPDFPPPRRHRAPFSLSDIAFAQRAFALGASRQAIADHFCVSYSVIGPVLRGHVARPPVFVPVPVRVGKITGVGRKPYTVPARVLRYLPPKRERPGPLSERDKTLIRRALSDGVKISALSRHFCAHGSRIRALYI